MTRYKLNRNFRFVKKNYPKLDCILNTFEATTQSFFVQHLKMEEQIKPQAII